MKEKEGMTKRIEKAAIPYSGFRDDEVNCRFHGMAEPAYSTASLK